MLNKEQLHKLAFMGLGVFLAMSSVVESTLKSILNPLFAMAKLAPYA